MVTGHQVLDVIAVDNIIDNKYSAPCDRIAELDWDMRGIRGEVQPKPAEIDALRRPA